MTCDPSVHGFAPAKVNLTLHVTGRRSDGYHLLDSLVAFADVGDRVTVTDGDGLRVTGPFAAGVPTDGTNLISRALTVAGARRSVTLDKQLPHPAGLGGGSSDAAAVLRLVGGADLSMEAALGLGADVPVCLLGRAARMRGIGEVLEPVILPALAAVLVNPGVAVPTPEVFRALTRADNQPMGDVPRFRTAVELIDWLATMRNDLEGPAQSLATGIGPVLSAIAASGACLARMSGSGATCFGLYADGAAADRAAAALTRPGWWVRSVTLA